jgi:cyclic beta-1,2-glucan synthetase
VYKRQRQAIAALNQHHPALPDAAPRFLLLHRQRVWSEEEGRWMGWERKRGKVEQLVSLLAVPSTPPFAFVDLPELSRPVAGTPYVLVLDADTLLPPGSLRALVSIAAHPANLPRVDAAARRVVQGHGVLQPRVALPLPTPGTSTLFHALTAGFSGLDPYAAASSEVYEDLFGEGSFSGKGLLHVQATHHVLGGRLPQGQVLSHDLLEGALLRCASVGDVALLEGAPVHPDVADSRLHRWTRGDWQLLPFIGHPRRWSVTPLNLWKMLDNLRRSLVAPACVALLLASAVSRWPTPGVALALVLGAGGGGCLL